MTIQQECLQDTDCTSNDSGHSFTRKCLFNWCTKIYLLALKCTMFICKGMIFVWIEAHK